MTPEWYRCENCGGDTDVRTCVCNDVVHLTFNAHNLHVHCEYIPARVHGYEGCRQRMSESPKEVTCRHCLEVMVRTGEIAVAKIVELDREAGEVRI